MKLFFGLISIALILTAICGAAMSWDGSYQFFKMLDAQALYVPHNRLIVLPAEGAVLLASRLTDNVAILQVIWGLVYAAILLGILAASWWIVRDKAPFLFVWVALDVGLGTIPGQFPIYSEATIAVQLFWPIALAVLTGLQEWVMPIVALFAAALFLTHPFSILLFGIAAGIAFIVGLREVSERSKMWVWALGFIGLAVLRITWLEAGYEAEQVSLEVLKENFTLSVSGLPLTALICAWFASALLFIAPFSDKVRSRNLAPVLYSIVSGSIAIAAVCLVIWASDILLWRYALGFRSWVLFCSLPFFGLAVLEGLKYRSYTQEIIVAEWLRRLRIIRVLAIIFTIILYTQDINWLSTTNKFQQVITQSQLTCISASSIEWLEGTPLYHPSVTTYSLLLQGRAPQKIVLTGSDCTEADFTTGFPIANWDRLAWEHGWFNMRDLATSLNAESGKHTSK